MPDEAQDTPQQPVTPPVETSTQPVFNETVETTIPTEFVTVQEIYDEYEATMKGLIE